MTRMSCTKTQTFKKLAASTSGLHTLKKVYSAVLMPKYVFFLSAGYCFQTFEIHSLFSCRQRTETAGSSPVLRSVVCFCICCNLFSRVCSGCKELLHLLQCLHVCSAFAFAMCSGQNRFSITDLKIQDYFVREVIIALSRTFVNCY